MVVKAADRELSRRQFIRVATAAASAFAAPTVLNACASDSESEQPTAPPATSDLPTLGGAPDTDEGYVIAAFVDTIVPGAHRDPKAVPGGIDVDAPAMFFDESLPAYQFVPLLVSMLNSKSYVAFDGRGFAALTYDEREQVVVILLDALAIAEFAIQLAKLAYFSSAPVAKHLGYPGPNPGYYDHPDFSFGKAMATEITTDGNLP